jgi:hypothetical protein
VFLRDLSDRWVELDRLADLGTDILDDQAFPSRRRPIPPEAGGSGHR